MERYKLHDEAQIRYIQVPKALMFEHFYKEKLSSDAKLLYGLLLDRMKLSRKNGWVNESNEIYLIMTRDEAKDLLGVSFPTASKAFKQLVEGNLIEEVNQGMQKPKRVYVGKVTELDKESLYRDIKNLNTGSQNSLDPDIKYFDTTDTNSNNNNISDTEEDRIVSINKLMKIGVDPEIAVKIANKFPNRKVEKAISYAQKNANKNPAGLTVKALYENYDILNEPDGRLPKYIPEKLDEDPEESRRIAEEEMQKIRDFYNKKYTKEGG